MKLIIVDAGIGNIGSLIHKLHKIGIEGVIGNKPGDILDANKLILPGVGYFAAAMNRFRELNLIDALNEKVLIQKTPILGICLGVQLFSEYSEEGNAKGLGWIPGKTIKFRLNQECQQLKVPHVGWNALEILKWSPLLTGIENDTRFYFTHSYHLIDVDQSEIICTTEYGYRFISAIHRENIYGTQFHPEKSHSMGMMVIKNFVERC